MISLLWAQTSDGIIGKDNSLPWNIKEEMQHFVSYTREKAVLMGRKTWDSIPKKPLKGRTNYIATRNENMLVDEYENTHVVTDISAFLKDWATKNEELVVIGGATLYKEAILFAKKLVISIIRKDYIGDTKMCPINFDEFEITSTEEHEEFIIITYERK